MQSNGSKFSKTLSEALVTSTFLLCLPAALPAATHRVQPSDQTILARVQHVLNNEPAFDGQPITLTVARGIVTLEGTVDSEAAKKLASNELGVVDGVKTVLNNLDVEGAAAQPPSAPDVAQPRPQPVQLGESAQTVTLSEDSVIPVRLEEELTTRTAKAGDVFHATTAANIHVGAYTLIPAGTPVTGRVVGATEAGHFSGSAELVLELTGISLAGQGETGAPQELSVITTQWSSKESGRGANTAEKTGGGAAVGAVIGALAAGGQGAAIGAASGGAFGAGTNAVTRGKEIDLKAEQLLQFRTSEPLDVTVRLRNDVPLPMRRTGGPALKTRAAGGSPSFQ